MDAQQIVTWVLVGGAGAYLAREGWSALRNLRKPGGGCGSGCGKCAFSGEGASRKPANVVSLSSIRREDRSTPR
jgi:hypothetical protein